MAPAALTRVPATAALPAGAAVATAAATGVTPTDRVGKHYLIRSAQVGQ